MRRTFPFFLLFVMIGCGDSAPPDSTLTIAVASNFAPTAEMLITDFARESEIEVLLIPGSTGKLTAQIQQGAPYDIFLSADSNSPAYLAEKGLALPDTQLTYALGRLVLYSRNPDLLDPASGGLPETPIRHLAIANPTLAPYGRAAQETLRSLGKWEDFVPRLVRGESISQAWHFVESGNAELGFVALSQLSPDQIESSWVVPLTLHNPIEQDAILLNDRPEARQFFQFLQSSRVREKIQDQGYELPPRFHAQ
ncbi:MAG: molybdate ABC transporter substrate-binding protein [Verrucomicrobiota bacterium]